MEERTRKDPREGAAPKFMTPAHENSMSVLNGRKLRQAWAAKGTPYCRHRHFAVESTDLGYATGFYICRRCGTRKRYGGTSMTKSSNENHGAPLRLTVALLGGALVGALLTLSLLRKVQL